MANDSPLEFVEQVEFVKWLEDNNLKFTSIPNNTYSTSWNQKRKNHAEGLRPGFSDLVVLIPPEHSLDGSGYMLCIEMKRIKGSVQSLDQKKWESAINGLNVLNIQYYLCKGAAEAIKIVDHYLCKSSNYIF